MKNQIQIMLVEDHPEYREIVEFALGKEKDMNLISEFGTAERALRRLQERTSDGNPDIILLDLNLPGMSGLDAIHWIKEYTPKAKVIILTQSNREADVLKAITEGASGYLLKSSTLDQITEGIRLVYNGGASLDAGVAQFILTVISNTHRSNPFGGELENLLTEREMDVLSLLAEGNVKKEIAEQLNIGISTVVTHVSHIYEKLQVPNAPAAIAKAFEKGILPVKSKR